MGLMRSLAILSHLHHRTGGALAAVLPQRLAGMEHALFDLVVGAPPPGDSQVLLMPHTHDGENGVAIPRGTVWTWDAGENQPWQWQTVNTGSSYWRYDFALGAKVDGGSQNDGYPANLLYYGSPGVDSSNTAVSTSAAVLECKLYYETNQAALSSVRIRNRTTGTTSTLTLMSAASGWLTIDIDTKGGVWNEIDVEAYPHSPAVNATVTIYSLVIAERRSSSQTQSSGSHTMAAAPKP